MKDLSYWTEAYGNELIEFFQKGVQTPSYSDEEGDYAKLIQAKMTELGFEDVYIDSVGNVVGRVGNGPRIIHFDSHMDTVSVKDEAAWTIPPFEGRIVDGHLYGRGSTDMKGGLSASVFAAALAKQAGLLDGKTVYVTASVCEEYCDGVGLVHFYQESGIRPNYCIICEPSDNLIALGHTGKVQAIIKTKGVSAHGSAPEKGVNAVYEMAEIIERVEALNKKLLAAENGGTIVLSEISCVSASLNAVPSECQIYLDRRIYLGESTLQVTGEIEELIKGKDAFWEPGTIRRTSWTGKEMVYHPIHETWKIGEQHFLTKKCNEAYLSTFGEAPEQYVYWDFSTNAVTPIAEGIPTIGFGPGEYKLSHTLDEHCSIQQVKDACRFYTELIGKL